MDDNQIWFLADRRLGMNLPCRNLSYKESGMRAAILQDSKFKQ